MPVEVFCHIAIIVGSILPELSTNQITVTGGKFAVFFIGIVIIISVAVILNNITGKRALVLFANMIVFGFSLVSS